MKYILRFSFSLLLWNYCGSLSSQILFTESFSVIIDSSRTIKGSIVPDLKFQTQKRNLFEFDNLADLSIKTGESSGVTFANKIEMSRFGSQTFLSGGYFYAEYRKLLDSKFAIEPYGQIHWAEARGMEWKYAGGVNLRYRIKFEQDFALFAGIGPFFEKERWSYKGVSDDIIIPSDFSPIVRKSLKLGSYVSMKLKASEKLYFDVSLYHQSRFDELISTPRIASSVIAKIVLTKHLGFNVIHQLIYDYKPVVPIRKDFHKFILGFSINF